ncbi:MAG: hypothetical protein DMG97_21795, partial [Acidobacteria bacterium]
SLFKISLIAAKKTINWTLLGERNNFQPLVTTHVAPGRRSNHQEHAYAEAQDQFAQWSSFRKKEINFA